MTSNSKQQLIFDIFDMYDDPLAFILYAFPWGKKGTPLENFPNGPDKWSKQQLMALHNHMMENERRKLNGEKVLPYQDATASGHGIGKSAQVAWLIIFFMSTRRFCRGVVTANTGDQLSTKTWPELSKWHQLTVNKHWFKWTATSFYCVLEPGTEKNWRFDASTWNLENTEAFAGLHNASGAVITIYDEASAIHNDIWEVTEGTLTDGEPYWLCYGNPTRNTGRFRECFGKFRKRWITRNVDSRTVEISKTPKQAQWAEDYGEDSDFFRVRVKGQFPYGGTNQFISVALVDAAREREVLPDLHAPLIMGVDVARFGDDQSVVRFRQGRNARAIEPYKYRTMDNMQLAYNVAGLIDKYKPDAVNIDAGNGSGVIDRLRELKYKVNEIHFGAKSQSQRWANKRIEMWALYRAWLAGGALDQDQELYDDSIGPEYRYAGVDGDKQLLESKADMKKRGLASPDDGDAMVLTFATKVARSDSKIYAHIRRNRVAKDVDYDIFG